MQRINSQMLISHAISILKATLHFKQNQVMHLHNICLPTIFRPRLLVLTETRGGWGLACRACRQQRSAQVLLLAPAGGEAHRAGAPGGSSAVAGSPAHPSGPVRSRARLLLASQTPRALLLEQSGRPEPSAAVPRARRENFGKSAPLHPHAASPSRPERAFHPLSPQRRGA